MKKLTTNEKSSLVDCRENEVTPKQPLGRFWDGYEDYQVRYGDDELPYIYKLKGIFLFQNFFHKQSKKFVKCCSFIGQSLNHRVIICFIKVFLQISSLRHLVSI